MIHYVASHHDGMMMAASVWSSSVLLLFLFVCPVFSNLFPVSFNRDELLNIRHHVPDNLFLVFEYSDFLLDILVGGAALLFKRRRRGRRAGALVKLRRCGFRTALQSIHLPNLRSLPNKTDELHLLTHTNKDFSNSAALCFTETWLSEAIPDSALHLPGFQLFRADRITELTGKTRGGGTCFYISESWCTDVTTLKRMCCPNLEAFFINCKPFYSPREFSSFILAEIKINQASSNDCKEMDQRSRAGTTSLLRLHGLECF
ncbi:uncharacterized protein LOC127414611 [Myxocyprinus asiaticus]|uniref:uncharacterized protein LOC127414611 n=1 Tax=Myxocyprinus asiaticus TaxID=70543 RepID=UPI002221AB2B|nr:uncharacterized protein LOC127414611 [Myxocyprinus asiaticus]